MDAITEDDAGSDDLVQGQLHPDPVARTEFRPGTSEQTRTGVAANVRFRGAVPSSAENGRDQGVLVDPRTISSGTGSVTTSSDTATPPRWSSNIAHARLPSIRSGIRTVVNPGVQISATQVSLIATTERSSGTRTPRWASADNAPMPAFTLDTTSPVGRVRAAINLWTAAVPPGASQPDRCTQEGRILSPAAFIAWQNP